MPSYVALLRGIAPMNPNMRNARLKEVFEKLGFDNVQTVISSGNVLFDSPSTATTKLEAEIERAFPRYLDFECTTIIRSKNQLRKLVELDPFAGVEHGRKTNLNVTFIKRKPRTELTFPYTPEDRDYTLLEVVGREAFSVIDLTSEKTPDLMRWLEKEFGKEITTRTFKTVEKILARFG